LSYSPERAYKSFGRALEEVMRRLLGCLVLTFCFCGATASAQPSISAPSSALQYVPVTPCRVVDTRLSNGPLGGPPIQGGTYRTFPLPQGSCNIPASSGAYLLNVTVVPEGHLSYLAVYPTGENPGVTTTMNSPDGRIKADAATVPAGTNGSVNVYASDTTNVIIDIYGYYAAPSGSTLAYFPLAPCRVIDTRNPNGPLGGPYLLGGEERDFPVLESTCIPAGLEAVTYSFNVTALPRNGSPLAYLTVWSAGQERPVVGLLNSLTGTVVSNAAAVPAGTGGAVAVYPSNDTDLVVDINGFFAPAAPGGLSLYPVTPCRVIDTRHSALGFTGERTVPVLSPPGLPCVAARNAEAFVFNATVYPLGTLNYLTLWSDGQPQPGTWTLNAADGAVTSNMAIVSSADGSVDAYASGRTQMTLDIMTYFAP
jgi:hypothetical protein